MKSTEFIKASLENRQGPLIGMTSDMKVAPLTQPTPKTQSACQEKRNCRELPIVRRKGMANYKDSIEIVSKDHWILASQLLGEDGKWTQIVKVDHRRVV